MLLYCFSESFINHSLMPTAFLLLVKYMAKWWWPARFLFQTTAPIWMISAHKERCFFFLCTQFLWKCFMTGCCFLFYFLQVVIPLGLQRRVEGLLQEHIDCLLLSFWKVSANLGDSEHLDQVDKEKPDENADSYLDGSIMEKVLQRRSLWMRNLQRAWQVCLPGCCIFPNAHFILNIPNIAAMFCSVCIINPFSLVFNSNKGFKK